MSILSFIPPATSKPVQKFSHPSLADNNFDFGADGFEWFLENATKKQFKVERFREKPGQPRPVAKRSQPKIEAKEVDSTNQSPATIEETGPTSKAKAVADGKAKETSPAQERETPAVDAAAEKDQTDETAVNTEQMKLSDLLAHLAEVEAVIRGETQPETVQMVEISEVFVGTEPVENIQAVPIATQFQAAEPLEIGSELPSVKVAEATTAAVAGDELKLNSEVSSEAETIDLSLMNRVWPQNSGDTAQAEGESLFNHGNPDGKGQVSEPGKFAHNVAPGEEVSQVFDVAMENFLKAEPDTQQVGGGVLARPDQSLPENGKVNLAVIQTQLAVDDASETKTDTPMVNLISQSSFGNISQLSTSASTGAESANPVNREELFAQLVEHAKVVVNNGGGEMEVNLKPEHLGKLQLKVSIENEVVTAKFVAESQQVKEIIESNLAQLKQNLEENGMRVDTIMVSVGNHHGETGYQQAAANGGRTGYGREAVNEVAAKPAPETESQAPMARRDTVIDLIA